jgi:HAD superfamily hydrolase (TIGR01509 family)
MRMAAREHTGLLLDVDGTLVDTEALHFRTWEQAFREHGVEFSRDEFARLFGLDPIATVMTRTGCTREQAPEIANRKAEIFRERAGEILPFPGAAALLKQARVEGIRIALVSSTSRADVENVLLPAIGRRDIVDLVVSSDMVARGKPEPDTLHYAMETLGIATRRALTAGDTVFDIEAGLRAGITSIGVTADTTRARGLQAAGAHGIVSDLRELHALVLEWMNQLSHIATDF